MWVLQLLGQTLLSVKAIAPDEPHLDRLGEQRVGEQYRDQSPEIAARQGLQSYRFGYRGERDVDTERHNAGGHDQHDERLRQQALDEPAGLEQRQITVMTQRRISNGALSCGLYRGPQTSPAQQGRLQRRSPFSNCLAAAAGYPPMPNTSRPATGPPRSGWLAYTSIQFIQP